MVPLKKKEIITFPFSLSSTSKEASCFFLSFERIRPSWEKESAELAIAARPTTTTYQCTNITSISSTILLPKYTTTWNSKSPLPWFVWLRHPKSHNLTFCHSKNLSEVRGRSPKGPLFMGPRKR